jgi:8-oxo-dGTP pyrophosphatase MutT (NUDIX family)
MVREISAGGIVIRRRDGSWRAAVIELPGKPPKEAAQSAGPTRRPKPVMALPKGLVDPGEKPLETAIREVYEETGIIAEVIAKLGDIKYIYTRTWAGNERVFKIVSFYLMRYRSGRIDDITAKMRIEVARALWIELDGAPKILAYKGEKDMARRALEYLKQHPDIEL